MTKIFGKKKSSWKRKQNGSCDAKNVRLEIIILRKDNKPLTSNSHWRLLGEFEMV